MGLLKKHKGRGYAYTFFLHVHNLSWPGNAGDLRVQFERGSHSGSTKAKAAIPNSFRPGDLSTYVFEQQLQLPATLYEVRSMKGYHAQVAPVLRRLQLASAVE
jgi:hypothetical protein